MRRRYQGPDARLTRKFIAVAGTVVSPTKLTTFVGPGPYLLGMVGSMIKSTGTRITTRVEAGTHPCNDLVNPDIRRVSRLHVLLATGALSGASLYQLLRRMLLATAWKRYKRFKIFRGKVSRAGASRDVYVEYFGDLISGGASGLHE